MALVVSLPSPASRYLVALGRAVAELRAGARVAIAAGRGRFARLAAEGLEAKAESLGLELLGRFPLTVPARAGARRRSGRGPCLRPAPARGGPPSPARGALAAHAARRRLPGDPRLPASAGRRPRRLPRPRPVAPRPRSRARARAAVRGGAEGRSRPRPAGAGLPRRAGLRRRAGRRALQRASRPKTPCWRPGSSQPRPSSAAFGSIPAPACSAATGCRSCAGRAAGSSCCSPKRPEPGTPVREARVHVPRRSTRRSGGRDGRPHRKCRTQTVQGTPSSSTGERSLPQRSVRSRRSRRRGRQRSAGWPGSRSARTPRCAVSRRRPAGSRRPSCAGRARRARRSRPCARRAGPSSR